MWIYDLKGGDWTTNRNMDVTLSERYAELGVNGPEAVYKVGLGYSWIVEKDWENILSSIKESISYSSGEKNEDEISGKRKND